MSNNKYDIKQAVKACLINYLEDKYQKEVETAIFEAEISEKVILLKQLCEKYPLLEEDFIGIIHYTINDAVYGVGEDRRNLSKEQQDLIDVIVDNSTNTDIALLVNDCKNLLNI